MWKVFMKVSCSWMRVLCLSRQSALLVSALNLRPLLLPLRKNFFHPFSPLPRCESGYYQNNNINLVWWGWGGGGWVKKVRSWRRLMQGPKLTFYYGRQLAIKYKFLVARGQIVVAKKIPPPFFQIKVETRIKGAWYGCFYAQKLHYFHSRYQKATVRVRVKSYFFHKLLFGDIKLSDLECRNRKLSAHDCTDHIKTLFSSDNYHETRNINTSQAAMPISLWQYQATTVPHYSYQSTKYITYLPYFSWKQHGGLETFNSYWS